MINLLLWVTMTSYWIALFLGTVGLFAIRLAAALQAKLSLKRTLFVVLTPLSVGYYIAFPDARPFRQLHRILSGAVFLLVFLASVWILYTRYA